MSLIIRYRLHGVLSLFAILAGIPSGTNLVAGIVTFGSGANQFTLDFVEIGNPGNAAHTGPNGPVTGALSESNYGPSPVGSVDYTFHMGKYEISRSNIQKYNAEFGVANGLEITLEDYANYGWYGTDGADKPAVLSWNEAARFVNWLNTSQGYHEAYKFSTSGANDNIEVWAAGDAGYDALNPFRNSLAVYVLPNIDEWYKAAYYDPVADVYYRYATGSNSAPVSVASGTAPGTAVYARPYLVSGTVFADVESAGGLSPYGVMAMSGNAHELMETEYDLQNDTPSAKRTYRGGWMASNSENITSDFYLSISPSDGQGGLRVAMMSPVPEPGFSGILAAAAVVLCGGQWLRVRRRCATGDP